MLDTSPTPKATLTAAREIARETGLRYVYTGNVHDEPGQSTYCPGCGACVIGRDWYRITRWRLTAERALRRLWYTGGGPLRTRAGLLGSAASAGSHRRRAWPAAAVSHPRANAHIAVSSE